MRIEKAHKIMIEADDAQAEAFRKACGCARFAYNWCVAENKSDVEIKRRDPAFKVRSWQVLKKDFNAIKEVEFPWIKESPKDANQQPFANFGKALSRYFKDPKNNGRPKFKKRDLNNSFYISNDKFACEVGSANFRVPVIGWIKLKETFNPESTDELKINGAVISLKGNDWYVSISYSCEVEVDQVQNNDGNIIALDMGLRKFYTSLDSDGVATEVAHPRPLNKYLKKVKKIQKGISRCATARHKKKNKRNKPNPKKKFISVKTETKPADSTTILAKPEKKKYSKRHMRKLEKLRKTHARIANVRDDFLHKTSRVLVDNYRFIVVEDLNITGWIKHPNFAKKASDYGIRKFFTMLGYKSNNSGTCSVIELDRWFPSSKICNNCKTKNQGLKFEETWTCSTCNAVHNRDECATMNQLDVAMDFIHDAIEQNLTINPGFQRLLDFPSINLEKIYAKNGYAVGGGQRRSSKIDPSANTEAGKQCPLGPKSPE